MTAKESRRRGLKEWGLGSHCCHVMVLVSSWMTGSECLERMMSLGDPKDSVAPHHLQIKGKLGVSGKYFGHVTCFSQTLLPSFPSIAAPLPPLLLQWCPHCLQCCPIHSGFLSLLPCQDGPPFNPSPSSRPAQCDHEPHPAPQ